MAFKKSRFSIPLRMIALVLSMAFVLQDVLYADPDLLLKSSTLAPRDLFTAEDTFDNFQRSAIAYLDRTICRFNFADEEPTFAAAGQAISKVIEVARSRRLPELPVKEDDLIYGVKISFPGGVELIYYNPDAAGVSESRAYTRFIAPEGKTIVSDTILNKYFARRLVRPQRAASADPVSAKHEEAAGVLQSKLKEELDRLDERILKEARKAVHVMFNSSRYRPIENITKLKILWESAGAFRAQVRHGLVTIEAAEGFLGAVLKAEKMIWVRGNKRRELESLKGRLKKVTELIKKAEILREAAYNDNWRSHLPAKDASLEDRVGYVKTTVLDMAERLKSISDEPGTLGQRLLELREMLIAASDDGCRTRAEKTGYVSRALYKISGGARVGAPRGPRLRYIAERLEAVVGMSAPGETAAGGEKSGPIPAAEQLKMTPIEKHFQEEKLEHYLAHTAEILRSVPDDPRLAEKNIRALFKEIISIYKSPLIKGNKDLIKKRKQLLYNLILINIIPPGEEEKGEKDRYMQSIVRSKSARKLIIAEVFASADPDIFQPALEAVIEIMARYHDYYFKRMFPLLEESGKLPHFARALIDVLIKAEHGGVELFAIEEKDELIFFDEAKLIIKAIAATSPPLRKEITAYLLDTAERAEEEIPLAYNFLDDIGFCVTPLGEFARISASRVAKSIMDILARKKAAGDEKAGVNVVFTGGNTMPEFLEYLSKILDGETRGRINAFQLCEYKGFGPDDSRSIAYFLKKNLPPEVRPYLIDGSNPDTSGYIRELMDMGGPDISILGVGPNGRIGFNEPSDDNEFKDDNGGLREVRLSRKAPDSPLAGEPIGFTIGLSDIMRSKHIFLFAEGAEKSGIVKKALFGGPTPKIPASALQSCPNLTVVLDARAMELLAPDIIGKRYCHALHSASDTRGLYQNSFHDLKNPQHIINREGAILVASKAEAEMLGYGSPEELELMNVMNLMDVKSLAEAELAVAEKFKRIDNDLPVIERRYRKKDGSLLCVRITEKQIVRDGKVVAIHSFLAPYIESKGSGSRPFLTTLLFLAIGAAAAEALRSIYGAEFLQDGGVKNLIYAASAVALPFGIKDLIRWIKRGGPAEKNFSDSFDDLSARAIELEDGVEELADPDAFNEELDALSEKLKTLAAELVRLGGVSESNRKAAAFYRDRLRELNEKLNLLRNRAAGETGDDADVAADTGEVPEEEKVEAAVAYLKRMIGADEAAERTDDTSDLPDILAKTGSFRERLRAVRLYFKNRRGMSGTRLAEAISEKGAKNGYHITGATILKYEKSRFHTIPMEYVKRLARLAGIDSSWILFARPLHRELLSDPSPSKITEKVRVYMAYSQDEMAKKLGMTPYEYRRLESGADQRVTRPVLHVLEGMVYMERGKLAKAVDPGYITDRIADTDIVSELMATPGLNARFGRVAGSYLGFASPKALAEALKHDEATVVNYLQGAEAPSKNCVAKLAELAHLDYGLIWFGRSLRDIFNDIESGEEYRGLNRMQKIGLKIRRAREYAGLYSADAALAVFKTKYGYGVTNKRVYAYENGEAAWENISRGMLEYVRCAARENGITTGSILFEKTLEEELASEQTSAGKLKIMRLYAGLLTQEMADKLGVASSTYFAYENGSSGIPGVIMDKARSAAGISASGYFEGYKDFNTEYALKRNANLAFSRLIGVLSSLNARHEKRKIILALDRKLGPANDDIRRLMQRYVTQTLNSAGAGPGRIRQALENLYIIDDDADALPARLNSMLAAGRSKGRKGIAKEDIVILTSSSNVDYFGDFKEQSFITSVDDSALNTVRDGELGYCPIMELIFFSIAMMALSGSQDADKYKDDIWQWYKNIPNIDNLDRAHFENIVYQNGGPALKKILILKLVPRAKRFGPNDLRSLYDTCTRELITKA